MREAEIMKYYRMHLEVENSVDVKPKMEPMFCNPLLASFKATKTPNMLEQVHQ